MGQEQSTGSNSRATREAFGASYGELEDEDDKYVALEAQKQKMLVCRAQQGLAGNI